MKVLLVNNLEPEDLHSNQPLLASLSSHAEVDSCFYYEVPPANQLEERYGAIVVSGAPLHYSADVLHSRLEHMQWVQEVTMPVLGICLGHQNIALLHGASMQTGTEAENGLEPITIRQKDALFAAISPGDTVAAHHSCSVSLPDDFELLAGIVMLKNFIQVAQSLQRV